MSTSAAKTDSRYRRRVRPSAISDLNVGVSPRALQARDAADLRDLELKIVYRHPADLKTRPGNARSHSPEQIASICASIRRFGFNDPMFVDVDDYLIAGEARLRAAREVGLESVPTIRADHMNAADARAYRLIANRLAEEAGWDIGFLKDELTFLCESHPEVVDMGWTTIELDQVFAPDPTEKIDPADEVPPIDDESPPVTRRGTVWICDRHRILCGDARDPADYERLLDGEVAQQVFTDPPYKVKNAGHVTGRAGVPEFAMAHGEMTSSEFTAFLSACTPARPSSRGR